MHRNPPNLPFSLPADQASPIVVCALGFDAKIDTHCMQRCVYPQVEDTCTMEHRPDTNTTMEDAPMNSNTVESDDATEIECILRNASISGCKDVIATFRSTDDDEDEGGGEDQVDTHMSDDLSFGGVGSVGASYGFNSIAARCSRQGNEEHHAEKEGDEVVDLLAHDVDSYEDAMRNNADGGFHAFLPSKPQSFNSNISHDKVYIYFTYLFNLKLVLHLLVNTSCLL